ncbi:hypothetical protein ACIPY0_20245 [Paenarthrobacter nicotinovorans]|uniref:hypothetical protein n=1 Tax=Paenarthrobacter nicotinovorans TaxID=29320 RepID=UPI003824BD60
MADELNPPADPVEPVTPEPAEPGEPDSEPTPADPAEAAAELERLRAALAKANKDSERNRLRLKELDDAKLSEIEKAQRDAAEAAQELANLRRDSLRQKVALETGLPAKWVARLQGDDEESLRADATEILADLNKARKPAPDPSQGPRAHALSDDDKLYESIFGSRKA